MYSLIIILHDAEKAFAEKYEAFRKELEIEGALI
jgi:hypothetical protein